MTVNLQALNLRSTSRFSQRNFTVILNMFWESFAGLVPVQRRCFVLLNCILSFAMKTWIEMRPLSAVCVARLYSQRSVV